MSTTGKEYRLAIRIAGVIDKSFTTSLVSASTALKTVSAMNKDFTMLDKGFNKIVNTGKKCFTAIATAAGVATVAIGAATAAAVATGTEFESAFAGVKKTVEATEEEYAKLRQDILDMSRVIPSSAVDIAGVMEIAGQLGVAKDSLSDFTETMINLGVSTNLSAEDAATALARFANIVSMENYGEDGISNYERLGSTIVDLGNHFATTEEEIVNIAEALAAAGNLANMSEADIMGISAAMSSVGLTAEAGASSMSRLIMQMQQAVAEGGDALQGYAETAGMSASQFADAFRGDAAGAVVSFIEGLNAAGEDGYGILEDLDLSTIRLRKSFLSLAGADNLMREALDMANEAWDENLALAIEAGKRYETTESKIQIMKNAFKTLGIMAYDDLQVPFRAAIDGITDGVTDFTDYVSGPKGISEWIENIGTELPTLKRNFDKYTQPVFDGLLGAGEWIVDHGRGIVSVLAGIGAALAAYKVASTTVHTISALMSLLTINPATAGILVAVLAIGKLVTLLTAYRLHERELINSSLAEHFGDIALSMEDIQRVAEHIISSDSLNGVRQAMEAFGELDTISATMEEAIEDINKMNWKVSIGMELSEDEQESYKKAISEYIASAEDYAQQSQYAVSLNLALAFDEADLEGNNVVNKVNQFYSDKYSELSELGTQLNEAVTEAFNDGLLDIEEAETIANIQAQMAAIKESLATGEFDAQLSILGMEYAGGGSLTADSFQNLQAELATKVAEATETYKDAYAKSYAAIQATYEAGGYLTDGEYASALDSIQQEFIQNVSELQAKSLNFQLETIMNQYADELDPAIASYKESVQATLEEYMALEEWQWMESPGVLFTSMLNQIAQDGTLDSTTQGAISQLLESMQPTIDEMRSLKQQYEEMGKEIPQALVDGLNNFDMLNALANSDFDSIGTVLGQQMVEGGTFDSFYQDIINQISAQDLQIPETVASSVSTAAAEMAASEVAAAGEAAIPPAVQGVYNLSQTTIDQYYAQGFRTTADLAITLNPRITNYSDVSQYVTNSTFGLGGSVEIGHRAKGGLATSPELTWFAEEGPEMAIPIDGSQNAINLWEQTGRLLGMDSALDGVSLSAESSGPTIAYSPTLQFYGEAPSQNDLENALKISQDEFESLMERYLRTQRRVSFG